MDGNKTEHEYLRGKGTYERTVHAIKTVYKYNKNLQIGTLMRKDSLEAIKHVHNTIRNIGDIELGIGFLVPLGNGKKLRKEVPSIKNFVEGIRLSKELGIVKSDLFKWEEDIEYLEKVYISEDGFSNMVHSLGLGEGNCGAGYVSVTIAPNGDVYPCVIVGSYPAFKMGNIFEDSLEYLFLEKAKKWVFRKTPSTKICGSCPHLPYCNKCFGYVVAFCKNPERLFP